VQSIPGNQSPIGVNALFGLGHPESMPFQITIGVDGYIVRFFEGADVVAQDIKVMLRPIQSRPWLLETCHELYWLYAEERQKAHAKNPSGRRNTRPKEGRFPTQPEESGEASGREITADQPRD